MEAHLVIRDDPARARVPVQPLLLFVFLMPLLPRPTVTSLFAVLAPLSIGCLVVAFVLGVASRTRLHSFPAAGTRRMFVVLAVPTLVYGFRILIEGQWGEEGYFAAKIAMSLGTLVVLAWLLMGEVSVARLYRVLLLGYLVLAVLMVYVGVTGNGVFEAVRPPRFYGITMPFYKAAGIPRSYGELAIFSTAVLAYLLVYRRSMSFTRWLPVMVLWVATTLIAQSRTGFIAAAVVLVGYVALRVFPRRSAAFSMIVGVLSIPIVAQWLYPSLQAEQFVSDVIGQSTFQTNVDLRVNMYGMAMDWLTHPSLTLLLSGVSRSTWLSGASADLGAPVVLHNYFLSTLMFFGVAGGLVSVVGLVVLPLWRVARKAVSTPDQELVFLASLGMVASLQFYEGFFSLILMWQLAMLWYVAYRPEQAPDPPVDEPEMVAARPRATAPLSRRS